MVDWGKAIEIIDNIQQDVHSTIFFQPLLHTIHPSLYLG